MERGDVGGGRPSEAYALIAATGKVFVTVAVGTGSQADRLGAIKGFAPCGDQSYFRQFECPTTNAGQDFCRQRTMELPALMLQAYDGESGARGWSSILVGSRLLLRTHRTQRVGLIPEGRRQRRKHCMP